MPSKVEFGRRLRWVLPLRPYPFFRRLAPWPFSSVAGALISRPLSIRGKNIAVRTHSEWYGSTVRRSICRDCAKYFALDRSNSLLPASKFSRALKLPEKA